MPKQAKLKAVLTLDDVAFARGIRHAIGLSKDLAKQFAKNPIKTTLLAGALSAQKGVQVTARALQTMGRVAAKAFQVAKYGALAAGIAIAAISAKSIGVAAQFETIETGFRVFLGSAEKARDRMKELVVFSSKTPFQLPQVAAASKTLEVLTHGMLSTGRGLELVGDIASATNRDFQETAVTVGRLFAALRSGTHPGEALASLQDSGAIGPEARRKIESMAGVDGAAAWKLAQKELSRFNGMMAQQSQTWEGMMSTFHDSILTALAAFGAPLIKNLKPALKELTETIFFVGPKLAAAGEKFGTGLRIGIDAIKGALANPSLIMEPLIHSLKAGFLSAGNVLIMAIKAALSIAPEILTVLKDGFVGLKQIIAGSLTEAFKEPIAFLLAGIESAADKIKELSPGGQERQAQLERNIEAGNKNLLVMAQSKKGMEQDSARSPDEKAFWKAPLEQISKDMQKQRILIERDSRELNAPGRSMGQRKSDILASGMLGDTAKGEIDEGEKKVESATKGFFAAIEKAIRGATYIDVLGAGRESALARNAIARAAGVGARQHHTATNEAAEKAIRDNYNESSFVYHGGGSLSTGGLRSGGLSSGSLSQGASRTVGSLVPLSERRAAAQAVRAAAIGERFLRTGRWTAGGALGVVRSGDRRAAMDYVRGKQREKLGLDKTNQILESLEKKFDVAWLQGGGGK